MFGPSSRYASIETAVHTTADGREIRYVRRRFLPPGESLPTLVEVTLVDRHDYHTFQPLLYQVATDVLDPETVGHPVREYVDKQANLRFVTAKVTGIDLDSRTVAFEDWEDQPYDYLVVGLGARANFFGTEGVDEFVLDYANREMDGVDFLANLPDNQGVQVGVLDIRSNMIDTPEMISARIRKVLEHVPAEKVTLSTDCGLKPLARMVAKMKLKNLAEAAAIVRKEIGG